MNDTPSRSRDLATGDPAGQCHAVLVDFLAAIDRGRASAALDLFTPDASFDARGEQLHGRDEIAALLFLHGRQPDGQYRLERVLDTAEHVGQRLNLAAVAGAPIDRVLGFGRERGRRHLRLLSSAGNTFKRDYHADYADGNQMPMLNAFHRTGDGIRHVWGSEMFYEPTDPGQDPRHVGTLEPLWNLFDLTAEGRPEGWHEQLSYT